MQLRGPVSVDGAMIACIFYISGKTGCDDVFSEQDRQTDKTQKRQNVAHAVYGQCHTQSQTNSQSAGRECPKEALDVNVSVVHSQHAWQHKQTPTQVQSNNRNTQTCTTGQMCRQTHRRADSQTCDTCADRHADRQTDRQTDTYRQTKVQTDTQTNKQPASQTASQPDSQPARDRQTARQTNRQTMLLT